MMKKNIIQSAVKSDPGLSRSSVLARFAIVDTKRKAEYGYEKIIVSHARGFPRRHKKVVVERWNGPQNGSLWVGFFYDKEICFVMDSRAVIELGRWLATIERSENLERAYKGGKKLRR